MVGELMLFDAFSGEPKIIEIFGYVIYVVPGWWTIPVVPAVLIFLFWLFLQRLPVG